MNLSVDSKEKINSAKRNYYASAMQLYNFYDREAGENGKELSSRDATRIISIEEVAKKKGLKVWNQEDDCICEEFIKKRMNNIPFSKEEYQEICEHYSIEYNDDKFGDIFYRLHIIRGKDDNIFKKIFKESVKDLFMSEDEIAEIEEKNFHKSDFIMREQRLISDLRHSIYTLIVESEKLFIDAENF